MEFLLMKDEVSNDDLMETLERNIAILKVENHHSQRIDYELETKLTWFNDISHGLSDKLDSLWSLAETRYPDGNEIKQFVDHLSNSWMWASRQICKEYSKIKMASRTLNGVPLSLLLDKIKKEVILLKVSLQVRESVSNSEYILKSYNLIAEIENLLRNLEKCDNKLQQYLSVTKITPQLVRFESILDKYVSTVQLLSTRESITSDLSGFSIVAKLLTGELLGHEPMDPNHVLAENPSKKPVFIIKNIKRKNDIFVLPGVKIFKNPKFICQY